MDSILYARILKLCEERGVTLAKLEEKAGLSKSSVSKWRNTNTPSVDKVEKVADYFSVSIDYLMGRTDVQSPNQDIRASCALTGLSEAAASTLTELRRSGDPGSNKQIRAINLLVEDFAIEEWGSQLLKAISDYLFVEPIPDQLIQFTSEGAKILDRWPDTFSSEPINYERAGILYDRLLLDRVARAMEVIREQFRHPKTMMEICSMDDGFFKRSKHKPMTEAKQNGVTETEND